LGRGDAPGDRALTLLENAIRMTAIVPHDLEICRRYAETKSDLELAGTPIADNDLWIASCALRHSIPLLSHNRRHFGRVPGIRLDSEGV
jgi:tRNA(fMet)-specific endonuclease VapC